MRIIIAVVAVTFFVLYEAIYNNWQITTAVTAEISRLLGMAGL